MRLPLALALAVTALFAFATIASGSHSNGNGPKLDLVAGTAWQLNGTLVHVNAQFDDTRTRGHFVIREAAQTLQGTITCVNVTVNEATLAGTVTKPTTAAGPIEIDIVDNGEPGTADMVGYERDDNDCDFDGAPTPIQRGNYIVHDGIAEITAAMQTQIASFEEAAGAH